ncbi:MAG: 4Fe-4S binding protein [Thermoplasmata archaeon]|nr:4Fe-4S binding protein [Thermoplasmata archaeon]
MALTRRSFIKVLGVTAGAGLISIGMQNATMQNIKAENLPGSGSPTQDGEEQYQERVDHIKVAPFLAACSRCGVCKEVCPFEAIKFEGMAMPQLTDSTRDKCPGIENCGYCAINCPPNAINEAFQDWDKPPLVGEQAWYEGVYDKSERGRKQTYPK